MVLLIGPGSSDAAAIDPWGVALALTAAAAWAGYIVLTRRVAVGLPGLEGLTVASIVSLALLAALRDRDLRPAVIDWRVVWLLLGVGVLSSALPYSLDTFILRRITPRLYAIITRFGPVIAALFGWLVLSETFTLARGDRDRHRLRRGGHRDRDPARSPEVRPRADGGGHGVTGATPDMCCTDAHPLCGIRDCRTPAHTARIANIAISPHRVAHYKEVVANGCRQDDPGHVPHFP